MTESEPLPTDWPTEPLPDRPVVWDGARFDAMLHEHVQARSPWDLPDLAAGRLRWEYEPFDDRGTTTITLRRADGEALPFAILAHWSALEAR
jgi:hypothetical protein